MTFDTGRFNMERIDMVRKIQSMRTNYNLSAHEFTFLVDMLHNLMIENYIPDTARHCEDILYEIFARMLKGHDVLKWFADKMRTDVLHNLDPRLAYERLQATKALDRSPATTSLPPGPINTFLTYEYLYRTDKTNVDTPSFSAISAIKEMTDDYSQDHNDLATEASHKFWNGHWS
jgi:hypothetical protein